MLLILEQGHHGGSEVGRLRNTDISIRPQLEILERDTNLSPAICPSITEFRSRIRLLLEDELGAIGREPRDVVIFAIDGIPYQCAVRHWRHAETSKMCSAFPTTSSTCWLSSLTGMSVARHGIPGVVFRVTDRDLVNVFEYGGNLNIPSTGNIFSDAARLGYEPWSIMGDLEAYDCSWRAELLQHSQALSGYRFYTNAKTSCPLAICGTLRQAINACAKRKPRHRARLIWCFIDADHHIHRKGYDDDLSKFLDNIEGLALDLKHEAVLPVAHSDHGLVRTLHNHDLENLLDGLLKRCECSIGGAGRTRWIYVKPDSKNEVMAELIRAMPVQMRVCGAEEFFEQGSIAKTRVGEVMLIAEGEEFMTFSDHKFDHGSLTDAELFVPLSYWPT